MQRPNSRMERPKVVPRVPNRRFLIWDPGKSAIKAVADEKIHLSVLVIFLASGPKNEPNSPLKLAPQALLCSQGMLETPRGVFLVGHAKSFDLRGVEAEIWPFS